MSNTCVQTVNKYSLRECGEVALYIVKTENDPGGNPRAMCLRHAVAYGHSDSYTVTKIESE